MLRWIMHVDMDAFFASVEQLDDPALRGKPVIVGGQSFRGVVSTCSYEARKFGVHSAMPMVEARRLCPRGEYVPGRMWRYREISRQVMAIFRNISPLVEQLSIDEAFLDLTGTEGLYGNAEQAGRIVKQRIFSELGLTASVGLAPNKFLAKMASDMNKPDGLTIIDHARARSFIAPLPVTKIFGIGAAAQRSLLQYGISTIGQLAAADKSILQRIFGKNAEKVHLLALGIDDRQVVPDYEPKSIGRETTFEHDLTTYDECRRAVLHLSEQTGFRLRRKGYTGHTLTLKVKYADFKIITRSITGASDISCDEDIFNLADRLLQNVTLEKGVRLLGVTVSNLNMGAGCMLGFAEDERMRQRNEALDNLKKRFGESIIKRGGNL